jgi:hypothetical protein
MKWNEKLSNILRTIGAIPYMFIVFAPSLILTIFNIYFNLSVFETVATALGLSYQYYQKLKWFVYLSSILLIMRPLIEQLFATTGNSINESEKSYLTMMKYVGIGIIGIGGIAYIMSYLIGDIQVNEYRTITNPNIFQSFFGFDKEVASRRAINLYEVGIDIAAMFASYFTETLAGFMLITSKDILFPSIKTTQPIQGGIADKGDMVFKREFETLYNTLNSIPLVDKPSYNKVNGQVSQLSTIVNKVIDANLKLELKEKAEALREKCKDWKVQNP